MTLAHKVETIFIDLKKELIALVGDLSGVHDAVNNAQVSLTPHLVQDEEEQDEGEDANELRENDKNARDESNPS